MKGLAAFVMRGTSQAVLVASVLALLSLIFPLLGILSGATACLVSLRQGFSSGLIVSLLATAACGLFLQLSVGTAMPAAGLLFLQWLPMLVLGQFLRSTRSLDSSVQVALAFGVLAIAGQFLLLGEPAAFWKTQLQAFGDQLATAGILDQSQSGNFVEQMSAWMCGILAAAVYLQLVFSLLTARWWQAQLYNPGGFKAEFHSFRQQRVLGVLGLAAVAVLLSADLQSLEALRCLSILLMAGFFIQGLAVVHGLAGLASLHQAWLFGLYLLLIILMPQVIAILTALGLMDVWIDMRDRYAKRKAAG